MIGETDYAPLRRALERDYRVEEVVRESSDGAVYLAYDPGLHRRVVVQAVDPVAVGEAATEAFRRQARVLAALNHHNIPSVHHAGPIEGFLHVVLEHTGSETLAGRLRRGPLPPAEVVRLGDQLLGALSAVHAAGFSHRAVNADHVLVADDRYVLDGFEQAGPVAGPAEAAGDVEAATRLLAQAADPAGRSERRLPPAIRAALRRPVGSAGELRAALLRPARRRLPWRALGIAAGLAVLAGGGYLVRRWVRSGAPPPPPPRELAIVPFEVDGGPALDPLGSSIAALVQLNLEDLPGLELRSRGEIEDWWEREGRDALGLDWAGAAHDLQAHWLAHGLVDRRPGDLLRVRLALYDSVGTRHVLPEVRAPAHDLAALGDSVTLQIVRVVAPRADSLYEPVPGLAAVPVAALRAFLQGEGAFARDAWASAQRYYEIALEHDSTFALAEWRLANVRRWRRLPYEGDLRAVYQRHAARFRSRDRLMIEALLEPDLERRFRQLDAAVASLPLDGYARLLQGEELFHRGPLAGRTIQDAVRAFEGAVALDPSLALAYDHLVLAAVRTGRRDEAHRALARRRALGGPPRGDDLDLVPFLDLVYDERFRPGRAWLRHRITRWREDPRILEGVEKLARTGTPWLDMPRTQLRYSDLLLRAGRPTPETYAMAHEGKGLALYALGRPGDALAELDSAAGLRDDADARLQQAEWRVIPAVLGLPPAGPGEWEGRLEELARHPRLGARAVWALALAAQTAGDTARSQRWLGSLEPGSPLRRLLEARHAALGGNLAAALARSDSVRPAFQSTRPPDPFAGAVFHLLRGDWFLALGDRARADREWQWYEASDVEGWPTGLPQAGEVDAALGVFARLKRARADTLRGCEHARRVVRHWAEADSTMQPLVREAAALAGRCAP